jgi:hypothetical protein
MRAAIPTRGPKIEKAVWTAFKPRAPLLLLLLPVGDGVTEVEGDPGMIINLIERSWECTK